MSRFEKWQEPLFDVDGYAYWLDNFTPDRYYGWRCQNPKGLKLGNNVDIGCFTYMNAKFGIEIGDNVQIGSHCSIYSRNTENDTQGPVKVGKDCLIGSHSLILPNSVIPDGAKIKAYSIVKESNGETNIIQANYAITERL